MRNRRAGAMAAIAAGFVLAIVAVPAGAASAHVSVSPAQAAQGGFAVLSFRVPNEREKAKTTKVQLHFPTTTPIPGATVRQIVGWTGQVVQGPLPAPVTVDGQPEPEAPAIVLQLTGSGAKLDAHGQPITEADQPAGTDAQPGRDATSSTLTLAVAIAAWWSPSRGC